MKILDLTQIDAAPLNVATLLNRLALEIRQEFNAMIEQAGKGRENDIDWWVSELANRNTFTNSLFLECTYLALILALLEAGEPIREIIIGSHALATVLRRDKRLQAVQIVVKQSWKERSKDFFKPAHNFFFTCSHFLRQWYAARLTRKFHSKPKTDITLVDTFVFPQSFVGGKFNDRYFDDFSGAVSEEEFVKFWYAPTFIDIKNYVATFQAMRHADRNFLLKEDFLTLRDYCFSLGFFLRTLVRFPHETNFLGFDTTPLTRALWFRNSAQYTAMDALLKFRFVQRLRETGTDIRFFLDWFENQSIDKAYHAGFARFYPNISRIGYQVAADHELYVCYFPTEYERKSDVLPTEVAVSGRGFTDAVRRFCPNLPVAVAPAFRYQHVWNEQRLQPDKEYFTILAALPLPLNDTMDILRLLAETKVALPPKTRIWIKRHPGLLWETIQAEFGEEFPSHWQKIEGNYADVSEKAHVVIGNNSSALLETAAKGIPLIIISSRSGFTQNPIPRQTSPLLWRLVSTPDELSTALSFFAHSTDETEEERKKIGIKLRSEWFETVSREAVRKFLKM